MLCPVTHYILLLVSDRNTRERISDESVIEIHGKESVMNQFRLAIMGKNQ